MTDNQFEKTYEALQIPPRDRIDRDVGYGKSRQSAPAREDGVFTGLELRGENDGHYPSLPVPEKSRETKARDEIRRLFTEMRRVSGDDPPRKFRFNGYDYLMSLAENARVFYKQAVFMRDFTDNYTGAAQFTMYYPYYQHMSFEQLRTYFTWRTRVRGGKIEKTSLSYAYLYIYELLSCIGAENELDGREKLAGFWTEYRIYDASIDRYLHKWLRDYHIYYGLTDTMHDFTRSLDIPSQNEAQKPAANEFELYCMMSKYNVRRSAFYCDGGKRELLEGCVMYVIEALKRLLGDVKLSFETLIFGHLRSEVSWTPFRGALFYPWLEGPDVRVALSEKEIYFRRRNKWTVGAAGETSRQLIGYIIKRTELELRRLTRYKGKLTVSEELLDGRIRRELEVRGAGLGEAITNAVEQYYSELNKVVVSIDVSKLAKIRQDADNTQLKLTVADNAETRTDSRLGSPEPSFPVRETGAVTPVSQFEAPLSPPRQYASMVPGEWLDFKAALNEIEISALRIVLCGDAPKSFADANGVMTEVLFDGINQKAFDILGDTIIDASETVAVFEEYTELLSEIVRE